MSRPYHKLVPYAFKRFSVMSAARTALPTLSYYLRRPSFEKSEKPALVSMNILPPLMTVWWHFAKKALGTKVDIFIFDCSGKLDPKDFPGATVQKYLNFYAATKCDEFLYSVAKHRKIGWMCDDDIFFLKPDAVNHVLREFEASNTASVSFRPRTWWQFEFQKCHGERSRTMTFTTSPFDGACPELSRRAQGDTLRFPVSSSYCTAINREIFCDREHLSLAPMGGNMHPTTGDRPPKSYDTFDKANEILLTKGYRCAVLPENIQNECITGFHGVSNGVMLLNHFKKPEQMLDYLLSPPKKQWEGSVLYNVFGALLAIDAVQDLAEKISGKRYLLPSLPSKAELLKIRKEHEPLLRGEMSWKWIDEASEKLQASL